MYFLLPHWVPATWRSLAQTSIRAEFPSGNVPTTRVLRRIPRFSLSITLLEQMPQVMDVQDATLADDLIQLIFRCALRRHGETQPITVWLFQPPNGVLHYPEVLLFSIGVFYELQECS